MPKEFRIDRDRGTYVARTFELFVVLTKKNSFLSTDVEEKLFKELEVCSIKNVVTEVMFYTYIIKDKG